MSYNVGIQNAELSGKHWSKKYDLLKKDVQDTFDNDIGIQILLISEFGSMIKRLGANVKKKFTTLLAELDLTHIHLEVMPPYVALIDANAWQVTKSELMTKICSSNDVCVQHLVCLLYTSDAADE